MALSLLDSKGTPLEQQRFTWKELVQKPISKLDDDAFTRVRTILMNGIETEAVRFSHLCARMNRDLQVPLARARRVDHHQATMVNWLLGSDHSPLETTVAYEQVAIEVTAALARQEPDPYVAQALRFALLEDFDHLYRYGALMDRIEGMDPNNILQTYTDIMSGRPTAVEHRAPEDDVRRPYERSKAHPVTKLNALTLVSGEYQTRDYYMHFGPTFADPVARQVYAEIASIEEQHVTHYESLIDPDETWLEKWLLHEANEAWNYYGCVQQETNPRIKAIWERMLDYEIGQFRFAAEIFKNVERRDPEEVIPAKLPDPFPYESNRDFVRQALKSEVDLRAKGTEFVPLSEDSRESQQYRNHMNSEGSPTETVAAGYQWVPGGELARRVANL